MQWHRFCQALEVFIAAARRQQANGAFVVQELEYFADVFGVGRGVQDDFETEIAALRVHLLRRRQSGVHRGQRHDAAKAAKIGDKRGRIHPLPEDVASKIQRYQPAAAWAGVGADAKCRERGRHQHQPWRGDEIGMQRIQLRAAAFTKIAVAASLDIAHHRTDLVGAVQQQRHQFVVERPAYRCAPLPARFPPHG
ncbi:hypothetical protein [Massilia eburnea]|uniref:hypothetical protein n=1 Tax=Massilia eburnea TaxID=1776165 RepID=UPI003D6B22FA